MLLCALPLLAGCISLATAADRTVLELKSGARIAGELIDVRDGRYWVLLPNGTMVSYALADVARVDGRLTGDTPLAVPVDAPPPAEGTAPDAITPDETGPDGKVVSADEAEVAPPPPRQHLLGGGYELGLVTGARLRFHIETPAIDHVDIRAGQGFIINGGLDLGLLTGAEIGFFGKSIVHLALAVDAGVELVSAYTFYPFVGVGGTVQYDPKGPFECGLGAVVGTDTLDMAVVPEASLAWVW
jgi:hypothetical protein